MSFACVGSHRSGKSTLAKALAERLDIPYFDASVSKIMSEGGFNGVADLPMIKRIEAQEYLIEKHWELTQKLPRPFITDRSPLDMIGYMLGEVTMHNTGPQLAERIQRYVKRCLWVTDNTYAGVIILRPLPVYEVDPTKPPENRAYQSLIQTIVEGSARQCSWISTATLSTDIHEIRMEASVKYMTNIMCELEKEKAKNTLH